MTLVVIFLLEFAGIIASIAWIASPEGMWWRLVAWLFREPRNVEPSDAAFTLLRVVSVITGLYLSWQMLRLIITLGT